MYLSYQLNSRAAYLKAGVLALLEKEMIFEKEGLNCWEVMVFLFALEICIF